MSIHTQIELSKLKHWCLWCQHGVFLSDELFCHCPYEMPEDINYCELDGGIFAAAEDTSCKYFDWNFTRPGAEWAKVVLDELDKEAMG